MGTSMHNLSVAAITVLKLKYKNTGHTKHYNKRQINESRYTTVKNQLLLEN